MLKHSALSLFVLYSAVTAAMPARICARTWYVNLEGTGDVPTIQAALDTAGVGDEIVVGPGHYTWSNQGTGRIEGFIRFYTRDCYLTFRSEMGPESTILDAEYQSRVIYCHGHNHVTVEGFTITRGVAPEWGDYVGGGFFTHIPRDRVRNCIFTDNRAEWGGAISCVINDGFFYAEDCVFEGNEATRYGGALGLANGTGMIYILGCTIKGNTASLGGGAAVYYNCAGQISDCLIYDNTSAGTGGAFTVWTNGSCIVQNCTIVRNSCDDSLIKGMDGSSISVARSILAFNPSLLVSLEGSASASISCSDIYGNEGEAIPAGVNDEGTNIFLDPLFCGGGVSDNFYIRSDSPCWPGNRPDGLWCMVMGALSIGCGSTNAAAASWGAIKTLDR